MLGLKAPNGAQPNHTVSCPVRTEVARPASAGWDIGAYEYSSSTPLTANFSVMVTGGVTTIGSVLFL